MKRGSLLNATHQDNHKHGVLLGRLTHNETAAHHNPSHLSAFLLKRLHEREAQPQHAEPMSFNQQPIAFETTSHSGNTWDTVARSKLQFQAVLRRHSLTSRQTSGGSGAGSRFESQFGSRLGET